MNKVKGRDIARISEAMHQREEWNSTDWGKGVTWCGDAMLERYNDEHWIEDYDETFVKEYFNCGFDSWQEAVYNEWDLMDSDKIKEVFNLSKDLTDDECWELLVKGVEEACGRLLTLKGELGIKEYPYEAACMNRMNHYKDSCRGLDFLSEKAVTAFEVTDYTICAYWSGEYSVLTPVEGGGHTWYDESGLMSAEELNRWFERVADEIAASFQELLKAHERIRAELVAE